ncbi:S10 family peptidase [Rhizorhabdus dicambivorans]|uniref:Peptidase S10 n=1 Tax=Rhizorhabdus dicambivorans TaxID=1850238 RepID=A0A2A4G149_9SPHN|nr:peptidase S10 [Rhizorhabdus dicambivorans]ATE66773.1 peptidase S10 [Rhizorhabdus dicambivorans]PCE43739.1 peptidase S10 [Rhizorhabdus dicambivorans]
MRFSTCLAAIALAALPVSAHAHDDRKDDAAEAPVPPPVMSVTRHKGVFGGQSIAYTATTGETYLKDKDGKPLAAIFATSYVKDGGDKGRPVTFLYNGGPGSGSVWLHMGAFGPKRVVLPRDAGDDGAPPYPVVDNPESLLDVTDIVFIDPVGTGFAHAIGKKDPKDYWGVSADAKSIAEFIRIWLNENGRWSSPKYIGGESYGTTRSVALINELEGQYNDVSINGIILISTILDFAATAETQGNEMPYILNLPSMAATAWYHRKIANPPATVAEMAAQARAFAIGPYAAALLKGNALGVQERASVRAELARLTGLSERFVDNADLRVSPGRFYKELLRDRGLTIGRLDTRYTGVDYDRAGEEPDNDPSFYGIDAAYTAAINAYLRDDLKLKMDRQYVTIGSVGPWDWKLADQNGRGGQVYVNVAPYLGKALRENSGLKVFVGQGWYDFATPFFGAEYAMSRTGFDPSRIRYHYYDAGHMMYVRPDDLRKLSADVRAFIRAR